MANFFAPHHGYLHTSLLFSLHFTKPIYIFLWKYEEEQKCGKFVQLSYLHYAPTLPLYTRCSPSTSYNPKYYIMCP
jgi:hypothetical protein